MSTTRRERPSRIARENGHQALVRSRDEACGAAAAYWRDVYDRVECLGAFLEDAGSERWLVLMRASYASNPAAGFATEVSRVLDGVDDRMRVTDDTVETHEYERRRRCADR